MLIRGETRRTIERIIQHAIGWFLIYTFLLLVILMFKGTAQTTSADEAPKPKKHIVYNYPVEPEVTERERYERLSDRMMRLETQVGYMNDQLVALKPIETEARMVKLEQTVDYIKSLLWAIALALGGLVLDAAHKMLRPKSVRSRRSDEAHEEA